MSKKDKKMKRHVRTKIYWEKHKNIFPKLGTLRNICSKRRENGLEEQGIVRHTPGLGVTIDPKRFDDWLWRRHI